MATYLVTGAAGFVAAKVCEFLVADGHTVVGIDNLNDYYDVRLKDYRLGRLLGDESWGAGASPKISCYANRGRLSGGGSDPTAARPERGEAGPGPGKFGRFVFEQADVEDLPALERLFSEFKFDAVFNLAARAGVRASMENPHVYLSTNAMGALNLLECQRKFGVKKLVMASTSSLYAGCPAPFTEDQPVNTPLSPYAASKKAAELMAYSYHQLFGLDVTIVRYFSVFGPAGRPDMSPFRFIKWIDEGKPLVLYGDGTQLRDFTYVDDVARGTILAAKPLGYEIINLGGGRTPLSLRDVIAYIERALGKKAVIDEQPFHAADARETWADIGKAGRLLGWRPIVSPQEGIAVTVDWHVANRYWTGKIEV